MGRSGSCHRTPAAHPLPPNRSPADASWETRRSAGELERSTNRRWPWLGYPGRQVPRKGSRAPACPGRTAPRSVRAGRRVEPLHRLRFQAARAIWARSARRVAELHLRCMPRATRRHGSAESGVGDWPGPPPRAAWVRATRAADHVGSHDSPRGEPRRPACAPVQGNNLGSVRTRRNSSRQAARSVADLGITKRSPAWPGST
jgi:hypothetical protein